MGQVVVWPRRSQVVPLMEIRFTIDEPAAAMLDRLALCIAEHSHARPSVHDIARSLVLEVLIDDAREHCGCGEVVVRH